MKRVLFIGDADADMLIHLDHIPTWDEGVLSQGHEVIPGGKAANTAVQYSSLGGKASVFCVLGKDDYASVATAKFKEAGLGTSFITYNDKPTTLCIILLDPSGEKAIVVLPSDDIYPDASYENVLNGRKDEFDHIHLIGLNPGKVSWVGRWARKNGKTLSVDFDSANGGYERCGELLTSSDLALFNEQGLGSLSPEGSDVEERMSALREKSGTDLICTLGKNGALALDGEGFHRVEGKKVNPTDTTGSGDAFAAGLLYSKFSMSQSSLSESIEFANACGGLATQYVGGQGELLKLSDVLSALTKN